MDIIVGIETVMLKFPVSHFISGWRCIKESWHLIALVKTERHVYGIGEGTPYGTSILDDYVTAVKLGRLIVGRTLDEATRVLREVENRKLLYGEKIPYGAFLALESAVLDALAKLRKVSIATLLGGEYRSYIPVVGTVFLKHPSKMVEDINMFISKGINHIKIKIPCNLEDLDKILNIITRKSLLKDSNAILRVDANECFEHYDKAVKALKIMSKYNVNIVEQPLPRYAIRDTVKLRKLFYPSIKIMLDESLFKPRDISIIAELEAADIVNLHPSKFGCLSITREAAIQAKKLGVEVQIGSALMTEIGLIHYLNLAASLPELDYPLEEVGLQNTSYGYSILCDPSDLTITVGFLKKKPYIKTENICLKNIAFSIPYFLPIILEKRLKGKFFMPFSYFLRYVKHRVTLP